MGKETGISWCDHTFNCWWGCTKVGGSPACDHCYAETWSKRTGFQVWGDDAPRRYFSDKHWAEPLQWNMAAWKADVRRRVFCMSMGDWAEGRPEQAEHLRRLWRLIADTDRLDWLMLTKRPQLISKLCPLTTLWQGTTTETQKWLDLRWPQLRACQASVYWLSIEPLFERIVLPQDFLALGKRAWAIVGGESGSKARPMHPSWVRYLRDQCVEAGVPFHFKQWGEFQHGSIEFGGPRDYVVLNDGRYSLEEDLQAFQESNKDARNNWPTFEPECMGRIGKKAAGHMLDGREYREFPHV